VAWLVAGNIENTSDADLKAVIEDVKRRHLELAPNIGLLVRSAECAPASAAADEAYGSPGETELILRCDGANSLQGSAWRCGQLRHVRSRYLWWISTRRSGTAKKLLREFCDDPVGVIDLGERFAQRADRDRDRAIVLRVEAEVATQRLDIAVEDQADDLGIPIDHR
jgi:hypothetical protein